MAVEVNQCLLGWDEWRREVLERRERVSLFEREVIENGELGEIKDEARAVDPDEKLRGNENSILGPSTSKERKEEEDESKKLTNEKEAAASRTTQEEEFQDHHKKFQKKKPTDDDEEAEHAMDEEADSNDEDVVKIYCKGDYHTDIFRNLAEFRDSFLLTDLTLSTEDRGIHRVILAVCSDYFRGMFTLGMRESHQPCVTLPFLLASELEVLIDSSYTGALPLSWKYVFEITSTALQLQYQPALSLCLNFLHQEINPHSCLDLASFAEAYEMVQLLEVADDYFLRQFQKVACTSKFKDLPVKQLLKYLNSRSLCVPSEFVLFKAVVAWIQAKPKLRLKFAEELMKTIHFSLMTSKEFKEVQSLKMWSDHSLAKLYKAVFEDFCSNESQCRTYLPKESLVLIGGDQNSEDSRSISRELWFGNSLRNYKMEERDMEWRKLGEMPEPERFCHEVAVLKGQLYVFGGKKYYGISDSVNSVYRYDPFQNNWESLAEMQQKRCSFSVVVLDGKIYAIGGHCADEYIESVERFCPTGNSWNFMWPLDLPLGGHVANVSQGRIFVSGGLSSHHQFLSSMFLYHPETGSTYLANMAKPRACHCMVTLGECLYVAGGFTAADDMSFVDQLACEVYNPVADSWTAFTPLPVPHIGAGGAVLEGKFYVLGGYSQENYRDTKMVHCYDPTTQSWQNMGKMPGYSLVFMVGILLVCL
uniref:Kelch-like family member 33 n=1 Tax=Sander lucioperca TaxID=283035 RepID=A0A8C9X102_SANLU